VQPDLQPDDAAARVIGRHASRGTVRRPLDRAAGGADIFVTRGGAADEPLLGWIADTRLAEQLHV
jgi:hypothetical protein